MRLVISQPMYFPWLGMFEQIQLSDRFVFYDDVQLPKGGGAGRGFLTRVQIKTERGTEWLSIPIARSGKGAQLIRDATFANDSWRNAHQERIRLAYRNAPYFEEVEDAVIRPTYEHETDGFSIFCIYGMSRICDYLGMALEYEKSSDIELAARDDASSRVLALCQHFGASEYVTGHGAAKYMNHQLFDDAGVRVSYMQYELEPYPQLHDSFTPYVSILDLLCNVGRKAADRLRSQAIYYKEWFDASA